MTAALLLSLGLWTRAAEPDFSMIMEPDTVTLVPGKSAALLVSLAPLNGFTQSVTLAVGTLPDGVTASFSRNPLIPPDRAVLTLQATSDAVLGPFRLDLTGTSASVTNSTGSGVTVNFGLLPLCYGAVKGVVMEKESGLPLAGVSLNLGGSLTDTNGSYLITNLALSNDNLPQYYSLTGTKEGYWDSASVNFTAICDATNEVNLQLLKKQYATITGKITDGTTNHTPIPGAEVSIRIDWNHTLSLTSNTNGQFQSQIDVGVNNTPASYVFTATAPGSFWPAQGQITVYPTNTTELDIIMPSICGGITVTGRVIYADTQLPATNANVNISGQHQYGNSGTDDQGNYSISGQTLNPVGSTFCTFTASAQGYQSTNVTHTIDADCGGTSAGPNLWLLPLPPPEQHYFGSITGHVYDQDTGQPLTNSSVSLNWSRSVTPDLRGLFLITNFDLGTVSSNQYSVIATQNGYFTSLSNVWLYSDQVVTQDLRVLRQHFGYVTGTVRDAASQMPLPGVSIGLPGYVQSATNGQYFSGPLNLNNANTPASYYFTVGLNGYWSMSTNVTVSADQTNVVDLALIKVCSGANILGTVVNAVTQEPIVGANVSGGNQYSRTDTNGHFALKSITVGNDNSPIQITVNASAPGFNPQSRTVTVFCGANILTEFGKPETVFGAIAGYVTNVLTGLPLTNVFMGSEFGAATSTDTNGYYQFTQVPLGSNGADATWQITAMPTGLFKQTKPILVSSNQTSRLDFGFGAPTTDLGVAVDASPNPAVAGQDLVYVVTLNNNGGDAENGVLTDAIDPALTFVRASVSDASFGPPTFTNGTVRTSVSSFLANATAILTIVTRPSTTGTVTNTVSVTTDTEDTNATNDRASLVWDVLAGRGTGIGLQAGPLGFNPQTGLFEQRVTVTPESSNTQGVQLSITGVSPRQVYNACGTTNGTAFVQCAGPLAAGSSVTFLIEYYLPDRQTNGFHPQFALVPLTSWSAPLPSGQVLVLDRDVQMLQGRLFIEFATAPGRRYAIQYSSDMQSWQNAVPPVTAAGSRVQWYDDGPPKTLSKPTQLGSRFYRVMAMP